MYNWHPANPLADGLPSEGSLKKAPFPFGRPGASPRQRRDIRRDPESGPGCAATEAIARRNFREKLANGDHAASAEPAAPALVDLPICRAPLDNFFGQWLQLRHIPGLT